MRTRSQFEDFSSEPSHALLDLPSQYGRDGTKRDPLPGPPLTSSNSFSWNPISRNEPSEALFHAYPKRTPFSRRLGQYLVFYNIGAIILLLGSVSVLSFLWFGNDSNSHWTTVMIDGWVGQAVTLSTLAVRLAVATQASTAVAMLATIQLEAKQGRGVLLADAPAISVARHGNTGPLTSILTFWNDASWTKCGIILPLMVILALCTLISQFTSTLLLWDVRSGVVHGFSHHTLGAVGMDIKGYTLEYARTITPGDGYWTPSPQSFPTFGEYNAKPRVQTTSIADTGPTIRALLPISSQFDRSMVSTFEGTAAVFDARVSCVRPILTDWEFAPYLGLGKDSGDYFQGYAKPSELTDELSEMLRFNQRERGLSFRCKSSNLIFSADPMFKICSFNQPSGGFINSLDPLFNGSLDHRFYSDFPMAKQKTPAWAALTDNNDQVWPVELGHTFLIIRSYTKSTSIAPFLPTNYSNFTSYDRGVWVDLTRSDSMATEISVSVTMCYDAWLVHIKDARIKS